MLCALPPRALMLPMTTLPSSVETSTLPALAARRTARSSSPPGPSAGEPSAASPSSPEVSMLAMSMSPSSTSISTPRTVPSRVFSGPPSVRMSPARRLPGPSTSMATRPANCGSSGSTASTRLAMDSMSTTWVAESPSPPRTSMRTASSERRPL